MTSKEMKGWLKHLAEFTDTEEELVSLYWSTYSLQRPDYPNRDYIFLKFYQTYINPETRARFL